MISFPVLDMELNRISNILQGFFVRLTLRVASLQRRTPDEVSILILLDDNGE